MEVITADIGGTHCRFALATLAGDKVTNISDAVTLKTAEYDSLYAAWAALPQMFARPLPAIAAIAIAAPVSETVVKMTNNIWTIKPANLNRELGLEQHILLNDFAAIGYAISALDPVHFQHICGPLGDLPPSAVISVIGPGTGLGVAILLRDGSKSRIVPTEGGHINFTPNDEIDDHILHYLRAQHGRVSVERVVSGAGLRAMFIVLAQIMGLEMPDGDDRALWTAALEGHSALAAAALDRFCQCLGAAAGDFALAHGAQASVIAGGLGLRLASVLPQSQFARCFAAKGRYQALMESLPVKLITYPQPGLFGAATALAQGGFAAR